MTTFNKATTATLVSHSMQSDNFQRKANFPSSDTPRYDHLDQLIGFFSTLQNISSCTPQAWGPGSGPWTGIWKKRGGITGARPWPTPRSAPLSFSVSNRPWILRSNFKNDLEEFTRKDSSLPRVFLFSGYSLTFWKHLNSWPSSAPTS